MILSKLNYVFKRRHYTNFFKRSYSSAGNVTVSVLPNGLRVATEETGSPMTCIRMFIQAGSRYENADTRGITHLIEHLAYKGFNSMSKESLEQTINDLGARMDVKTTREYQVFSGICPSNCAYEVMSILAKIITDLELSECELAWARESIALDAKDFDMDPRLLVFENLNQTAFQGTPLGNCVYGPEKNIERLSRACVYHFLKNNYTPLRIVLASSGGISHQNMMSSARQSFCSLPCDNEPLEHGAKRFTASQLIYRDDSMPFAHVSIAIESPGYDSEHYLAFLVAKHIIGSWDISLGGTYRHAPYLAEASANTQCCDKYEAFYIAHRDVGLWGTYFVSPRNSVDDMVHILLGTWMHLCTTTRETDVQRGVHATKMELAKRADGVIKSSFDLGLQILFRNEQTPLQKMFDQLSVLSATTFKDILHNYIYNRTLVVSATGPTEALPDYNRLQAGTYWLRV